MLYPKMLKKNDKGIALLFSLIMLALLLILALAFALDSMFAEKAAYNSANSSSAGFLAKTQLEQILSLIQNNEANFTNSEFYSATPVLPLFPLPMTDRKICCRNVFLLQACIPLIPLTSTGTTSGAAKRPNALSAGPRLSSLPMESRWIPWLTDVLIPPPPPIQNTMKKTIRKRESASMFPKSMSAPQFPLRLPTLEVQRPQK